MAHTYSEKPAIAGHIRRAVGFPRGGEKRMEGWGNRQRHHRRGNRNYGMTEQLGGGGGSGQAENGGEPLGWVSSGNRARKEKSLKKKRAVLVGLGGHKK